MKRTSVLAFIALVAAISALRADIIPSFAGTSPSGTNTVWGYRIDITSGAQVTAGDFFTIYDFGPFIAGSNIQPTGWTFSSSLVTAPPSGTLPPDNPNISNLTWTYTGSTPISASNIGPFSVTVATSQFQGAPANATLVTLPRKLPERRARIVGSSTMLAGFRCRFQFRSRLRYRCIALAVAGSALKAIRRRR